MNDDPIVEEIHKYREEIAIRFNYDIRAIFNYYKQLEEKYFQQYFSEEKKSLDKLENKKILIDL